MPGVHSKNRIPFFPRVLFPLQLFGQCTQVAGGDVHAMIGAGCRIEHTLFLNIGLKHAPGGAHRVAAAVSRRTHFAGFGAHSWHKAELL